MTLAFLDVWHSRPIAPTRRVALGDFDLPTDPAPGPGGLLLGAVIARFAPDLDRDILAEMKTLMGEVERGDKIGQPRLRHRLQKDIVGLSQSTHRLVVGDEGLRFELEMHKGLPAQSALAAVYACERVPLERRPAVISVLRRGLEWVGPLGPHRSPGRQRGCDAIPVGALRNRIEPVVVGPSDPRTRCARRSRPQEDSAQLPTVAPRCSPRSRGSRRRCS